MENSILEKLIASFPLFPKLLSSCCLTVSDYYQIVKDSMVSEPRGVPAERLYPPEYLYALSPQDK